MSVHQSNRHAARVMAVLAVLALVAAGCTRSKDDVQSGGGSTTTAPGGTSAPDSGAAGPGDFGTLKDVCGPAPSSEKNTDSDQGVTADQIEIGTISDPGFVGRPGLNQELFDASHVFEDWCNAAGGINGRKIKVVERDAKLTEYKQRITEACSSDFFLVGGGAVFDDTGQDERLSCLLPDVPAYLVSPTARGADLEAPPLPSALDEVSVGVYQYLEKKFPASTDHVGFMTGNVPATVTVDKQNQEGVKQLGWKVAYQTQYNAAGEASWTPFAQAMKQKGVRGVVYTGEPENGAALLKAFDDIDYHPDWVVVGANFLDENFIKVGGQAVKNVFTIASIVPFFMADKNKPTQQYLDLFDKYLPSGKSKAVLGYNSWSAWLLFATSAKKCGADLTRRCVFDNAKSVKEWTGGGLHASTDPSSSKGPRCGMIIEASPSGFEVPKDFKATDGLYHCDDSSVVHLKGDYGTGAKLSDVGKSMDDLK